MDEPNLGHAVIVNNVAQEFPGSFRDVEEMTVAFERMGLEVDPNTDCNERVSDSVSSARTVKTKFLLLQKIFTGKN